MSKGKATHENILNKAFELASKNGLESLTIGELAKQCAMSKSGLFAHFNSKENLQVSLVEHAKHVFIARVIIPVRDQSFTSIECKLKGLLKNWLGWNQSFHGSNMFLDALKEASREQSLTQQALKETISNWIDYLHIQIAKGVESKEFHAELDPKQAAFELYGLYLSAQLFHSVYGEQASHERFWNSVERLINSWR